VADGAGGGSGPLRRRAGAEAGVLSPSGVFGDPTLASWSKGQRVVEAMTAGMLREIDALAAAPLPSGTLLSALDPVPASPRLSPESPTKVPPPKSGLWGAYRHGRGRASRRIVHSDGPR